MLVGGATSVSPAPLVTGREGGETEAMHTAGLGLVGGRLPALGMQQAVGPTPLHILMI